MREIDTDRPGGAGATALSARRVRVGPGANDSAAGGFTPWRSWHRDAGRACRSSGLTPDERSRAWPGDKIAPHSVDTATRGVTIRAHPKPSGPGSFKSVRVARAFAATGHRWTGAPTSVGARTRTAPAFTRLVPLDGTTTRLIARSRGRHRRCSDGCSGSRHSIRRTSS